MLKLFPGLADMSGLASLQSNQSFISLAAAQTQAAAAAAAAAALGGYGKIMQVNGTGTHVGAGGAMPLLTSYRYSPYQLPTAITTNQAAQQAQVAALIAHQQFQAQQPLQDQVQSPQSAAGGQQQQHHQAAQSVQPGLAQSIGTAINLGSGANIPAGPQASHLTSVLPTVTISASSTLTSPAVASQAGNLAVAAAKYAASVSGQGSINPNPFQVNGLLRARLQDSQPMQWEEHSKNFVNFLNCQT